PRSISKNKISKIPVKKVIKRAAFLIKSSISQINRFENQKYRLLVKFVVIYNQVLLPEMSKKEQFIETLNAGYTFKGESIILGASKLGDEVIPEAVVKIPLKTLNRHGLIAGATGTGKTKSL